MDLQVPGSRTLRRRKHQQVADRMKRVTMFVQAVGTTRPMAGATISYRIIIRRDQVHHVGT